MKERGIIFTGENARAIREGRKTQTRRLVAKPEPSKLFDFLDGGGEFDDSMATGKIGIWNVVDVERSDEGGGGKRYRYTGLLAYIDEYPEEGSEEIKCPYGVPGDRLWVREGWRTRREWDGCRPSGLPICSTSTGGDVRNRDDWDWLQEQYVHYIVDPQGNGVLHGRPRSARFMPRWASRTLLEVVTVSVERLQQIDEEDALAEGIDDGYLVRAKMPGDARVYCFRHMWDSINSPEASWEKNPWVWVIEFRPFTSERVARQSADRATATEMSRLCST
jgi:hypothetical protein